MQVCDSTCQWCSRNFFKWWKNRVKSQEAQAGRSGEGSFNAAIFTSRNKMNRTDAIGRLEHWKIRLAVHNEDQAVKELNQVIEWIQSLPQPPRCTGFMDAEDYRDHLPCEACGTT